MTSALATAVVLCLSPREISFIFYTAMTRKLSAEKKIEGFWGTLDGKQVSALHSSAYEYVGECGAGGSVAGVINTLSGRRCQVVFHVVYLLSSFGSSQKTSLLLSLRLQRPAASPVSA